MSKNNKLNKTKKEYENNNDIDDEKVAIKILIVGDVGVGKSNFIYRYIEDKFSSTNLSSVGFDSNYKNINFGNKKVLVQLWDSAGQSMFKSVTISLFNRIQGIIILYDISDINSFLNVEKWIKLIEAENKKLIYQIAGNKCDLNELRKVDINEGKKLGQKYGINFMETSAKNNINIQDCVNCLVKKILDVIDLEYNPTFLIDGRSYKIKQKSENEKCC